MGQPLDSSNPKYQMLKEIFPEKVKQINFATIDMDVTMLSIADVLRNINRTFPKNTAARNAIANGQMAVAVMCKTDLLKPISGLIIIVCGDGGEINVKSKDYIVVGISEETIGSGDKILDMLDKFTTYLMKNYGEVIPSFEKFYSLYVYDAYELEEDDG
jgi:hypothetical protein